MTDLRAADAIKNIERYAMRVSKGEDHLAVLSSLGISEYELETWLERYAPPFDIDALLKGSRFSNCTCPLFKRTGDDLDQIGSGVLLSVGPAMLCLTAAHVYGRSLKKALYVPGVDEIVPMNGRYFFDPHPNAGSPTDNVDIGFCRLDSDIAAEVANRFQAVTIDDVLFTDITFEGDQFTFTGFPWRKTTNDGAVFQSEFTTYTGYGHSSSKMAKMNLDPMYNIGIRFRRKKAFSHRLNSFQTANLPHGISGGAILAWPHHHADRLDPSNLRLAGIGHTYPKNKHSLVGTRMIPVALSILMSEPDLAPHFPDAIVDIFR